MSNDFTSHAKDRNRDGGVPPPGRIPDGDAAVYPAQLLSEVGPSRRRAAVGRRARKKPAGRINGIIFDMDGVLCDSEPFIAEAAGRMFSERFGLAVRPDDFKPFVGAGEDRFLGGVAEAYGVALRMPDDKDRTYAIYLEIIRGRLHPLPGVLTFIAQCRAKGLRLAIASSADRIKVVGNLKEIGVSPESFDACINGSEVKLKKPFPDIFLAAARQAAIRPANALVVEDAPNGIKAAKAAGMRALGITSSFTAGVLAAAGAEWTAPDLAHVPEEVLQDCEEANIEHPTSNAEHRMDDQGKDRRQTTDNGRRKQQK